MKYPRLFSPWTLSGVPLRNRLAHAAILTHFARGGKTTPRLLNYLAARAEGGAGLIVMEPLAMLSHAPAENRVHAFDDAHINELAKLVDSVERHDSRLLAQVQDPGRGRHEVGRNDSAIGVSALPDDLSWTVPHELTTEGVEALIREWAESCQRLQRAGFAGVELSAGHGHLFHQFLSAQANHRDDKYGGSVEGRCQFLIELVRSVRRVCGSPFLIGIKLPGEDFVEGGIDIVAAGHIAGLISSHCDIDYWTFAWGAHADSLWAHLPGPEGPRSPYLEKIRRLRQSAPDIPTGALGYITDPAEAEAALSDGTADLVFLGRPLIADAAWGAKAKLGREGEIRYCVSCNSCWKATVEGSHIACDNNPALASEREAHWRPTQAVQKRRIVVVGAGVAGLECAWIAAARGHEVSVMGSSQAFGGKTRIHAELPGGENLSSVYDFQYLAGKREGVEFLLGQHAKADDILALEPEVVVLATGSRMLKPEFVPQDFHDAGLIQDLRTYASQLTGRVFSDPGSIVIFDQDHTEMTYAMAEFLSHLFSKVILVTPRDRIASDCSLINRQKIYKKLYERNVWIITSSTLHSLEGIEDGYISAHNIYNAGVTLIDNVSAVTYAISRTPNTELLHSLGPNVPKIELVGDAFAPRSLMSATHHGFSMGNLL